MISPLSFFGLHYISQIIVIQLIGYYPALSGILFVLRWHKLLNPIAMDGWDAAIVMIISGFVLYLFARMVNCFIKRVNEGNKERIKR